MKQKNTSSNDDYCDIPAFATTIIRTQKLNKTFDEKAAFLKGTIFPELIIKGLGAKNEE